MSTSTSSFPPVGVLLRTGIWLNRQNLKVWLLIYTCLRFILPDVYCLSYPLTLLARNYLTQRCRCFQISPQLAYDIAVVSNAISCANELRFPCISTSVFTATHAEILSVTSCLLNSVIIKTGFRCKTSS